MHRDPIRHIVLRNWRSKSFVGLAMSLTFSVVLAQVPAQRNPITRTAYSEFALRQDGNAERGRDLFLSNPKTACFQCHRIDNRHDTAGPNLAAVGDKFPRRELIQAILAPSSSIAVGYGATLVETKDGESIQGVVQQSTAETLELRLVEGQLRRIPKSEIVSQNALPTSLMPEGLETGLTLQEFADLIAFLESLRLPENAFASTQGMPAQIPKAAHSLGFTPLFGQRVRLTHPVWLGEIPGATNRFIVLEHGGKSWIINPTDASDSQSLFLDLSKDVRVGGATGLLGLCFHPQFTENRKYYLKYQLAVDGRISTVLVERQFSPDFRGDSSQPSRELLRIPSVTQDHNGGSIEFGPDGLLYLGMGDTGPQRDPQGHGQDMTTLLGKLLRIDVNRTEAGRAYGIPKDNPFVNAPNARPEIWAAGFREPWRFSFDRTTGDCWVGDVGQDQIEEVSIVRAGENHGWNVYEGFTPFSNQYRQTNGQYTPPIFAYSHRLGVSITAGYVYRGAHAPRLVGQHICGDFESRRLWALQQTNRILQRVIEIGRAPSRIASFTQFSTGELGLVGYDSGECYTLNLGEVDPTPLETRILTPTSEKEPLVWSHTLEVPAPDWMLPSFTTSTWSKSPGGFGTYGTPGSVVRTEWRSADIWIRREFLLKPDQIPKSAESIALRIHHDEDVEVYLNGVEAAKLPRWTSGYVDVPLRPEAVKSLKPGTNLLAIHCHQNGGGQYIDAGLIQFVRADSGTSIQASP